MAKRFFRTPWAVPLLTPRLQWRLPDDGRNAIYLTFDDGPVPEATPRVLEVLDKFNAKTTFFCVGENVEANPGVFEQVKAQGHAVGNHTYRHLDGWRTPLNIYLDDIRRADEILQSPLFRPPYGRIPLRGIGAIAARHQVVMWSHLSYDFHPTVDIRQSIKQMVGARGGSIMVFHDSQKAWPQTLQILPAVLEWLAERGMSFDAIPIT